MVRFAKLFVAALVMVGALVLAKPASAAWGTIYLHGHNSAGKDIGDRLPYWASGSNNFVNASKGTDYAYVVSDSRGTYNSKDHHWWYWSCEVLKEIDRATTGQTDAGGRVIPAGSTYRVIAHSEGGAVLAYLLGNTQTGDPDRSWLTSTCGVDPGVVMPRISYAHTMSACPNCNGADAACNGGGCEFIADVFAGASCGNGTRSLRTSTATGTRFSDYMNMPTRTIYLMGSGDTGFDAGCISDPNDYVVSFGSAYFCSWTGFNGANWDKNNRTDARKQVCNSNEKFEAPRANGLTYLKNEYDHEVDHGEMRNNTGDGFMYDYDARTVRDSRWTCGGVTCTGDQVIADDSSKRTGWYYANYK